MLWEHLGKVQQYEKCDIAQSYTACNMLCLSPSFCIKRSHYSRHLNSFVGGQGQMANILSRSQERSQYPDF